MTTKAWLASGCLLFLASSTAADAPERPDLEVVLMIDGGFTVEPHYFLLKVNFSGEIEGGGDLNPGLPPPPERLSAAAHAELATLLEKEDFFRREHGYLGCIPDLGGRSISAWQGRRQRRVTFCVEAEGLPLGDVQWVLRLWYGVLSVVADGAEVPVGEVDRELLARRR